MTRNQKRLGGALGQIRGVNQCFTNGCLYACGGLAVRNLSVIVPTRDRGALLSRCLESIGEQTIRPRELIIVDDSSAEDCRPVVPRDLLDIATVIRLPKPTNAANARNVGIDAATGDIFAFVDSDDYWLSSHLEVACRALMEQQVDFLFGNFHAISESRSRWPAKIRTPVVPVNTAAYLTEQSGTIRTSTFVGRSAFIRSVKFDSKLAKHQDWDFSLRAGRRGRVGFNQTATVYIDHAPSCRMSGAANPEASAYFLSKYKHDLPAKQWRYLFRRILKGASQVSDQKACDDLLAKFRSVITFGDTSYARLCSLAAARPFLMNTARSVWRMRHLLNHHHPSKY